MFLINPTITNNNQNNAGLNYLLKSIDNKIGDLATTQYFNTIYGFNKLVDMDLYEDLCEYKEILLDMLLGCNCLEDLHLVYITSRIQRLVNRF